MELEWRVTSNVLEQPLVKCFAFVLAEYTQGRKTLVAIFKLLGQSVKKLRSK